MILEQPAFTALDDHDDYGQTALHTARAPRREGMRAAAQRAGLLAAWLVLGLGATLVARWISHGVNVVGQAGPRNR